MERLVHTECSAWGCSWSPGSGHRLPFMTTRCQKPDHEMTTYTTSSLVLHWGDPEAGPQGDISASTPTTALLLEKALTSLPGAGGGGYIQAGISSSSWFSLVAKIQDSSSRDVFVRVKQARVEENDLPCPVFIPVWASLPEESQWVGPQPTTVIGVAKDTECLSPLKEI